ERLAQARSGVSGMTPMTRPAAALPRLLAPSRLIAAAAIAAAAALSLGAVPPKLAAGNGTLYIGGWPNKIFVVDEASEKVTGSIDVTTGDPTRMVMSRDRKRLYLGNAPSESVEIIDIKRGPRLRPFHPT